MGLTYDILYQISFDTFRRGHDPYKFNDRGCIFTNNDLHPGTGVNDATWRLPAEI